MTTDQIKQAQEFEKKELKELMKRIKNKKKYPTEIDAMMSIAEEMANCIKSRKNVNTLPWAQ